MHSIIDLQEQYHKVLTEAPFGVWSQLKRAFTPMSKTAEHAQAYSQQIINNWYKDFVQQLANKGKTERAATASDVAAYTTKAIHADATKSKTWKTLTDATDADKNLPHGQKFSSMGEWSLGNTFARVFYEVDAYDQEHPYTPTTPTPKTETGEGKGGTASSRNRKQEQADLVTAVVTAITAAFPQGITINNNNIQQVADQAYQNLSQTGAKSGNNKQSKTKKAHKQDQTRATIVPNPAETSHQIN